VPLFYVVYWYRCYFPGTFNIPLLSPYPTPIDVPPLHIPLLSPSHTYRCSSPCNPKVELQGLFCPQHTPLSVKVAEKWAGVAPPSGPGFELASSEDKEFRVSCSTVASRTTAQLIALTLDYVPQSPHPPSSKPGHIFVCTSQNAV
jgi:hypothetical protein